MGWYKRERELLESALRGELSRREVMRRAVGLGLSAPVLALILAACGGGEAEPTATTAASSGSASSGTPPTTAAAAAPTNAAQPSATAAAAPTRAAATPVAIQRGGTLKHAIEGDPAGFDPAFFSVPGRRVARAIYDPILELDEKGELQPGLAERWEQPDDTTYVFHIRQGIKFHDGTPLTAEAVKFHFDRHLDPETGSFRRSELGPVDTVEVTDPTTVTVKLKTPFASFLYALFDWVGFVISPAAYQQWGKDNYRFHPSGTGPFKFTSYTKDVETVVERNPDYWRQGEPYLEGIVFRPIPLDATRLTELRSGGVHIAEDMPFQNFAQLKSTPGIVISEKQGFRWDSIIFNTKREPYNNKPLRQSLNWALDREAIQQAVYFNTGLVGYDAFLPGTPYYDPNYKPFTRDVNKAKQLLQQSGVPGPLNFTAHIPNDAVNQKVAEIMQANLADVGVNLSIVKEDSTTSLNRRRSGDYDISTTWFGYRPDPDTWIYAYYHSKGSNNYYGFYNNPEADELIIKAGQLRDRAERVKLYRQIAVMLNDDAPNVFFHYGSNIKGLSPKVKGFVHFQDSMIRFQRISLE